jgi:2-keto-3-deoxy-L-rhamnonate aldolase RhmA
VANKLKAAWRAGKKTMNGRLAILSAFSDEVMAPAGFNSLKQFAGVHCKAGKYVERAREMRFTFGATSDDAGLMLQAARAQIRAVRD